MGESGMKEKTMKIVFYFLLCGFFLSAFPAFGEERKLYHSSPYSSSKEFLKRFSSPYQPLRSDVFGGIAPHHAPVTFPLLAQFYGRLKATKEVTTFIILAPDHFNHAKWDIVFSRAVFGTPYGVLYPNELFTSLLEKEGVAVYDEMPFQSEHAIHTHTLFIRKFFPAAKIVPIIFRSSTRKVDVQRLGDFLGRSFKGHTFIVSSVDFSHYFDSPTASRLDARSALSLQKGIPALLSNVRVDSPAALGTLLYALRQYGTVQAIDMQSLNMADLNGKRANTTGYVIGYYGFQKAR